LQGKHFYIAALNTGRSSQGKAVRWSVCPYIRLSNACIVTKPNKDLSRFVHYTKEHLAWFTEKKNGLWGRPLLPEILGQPDRVGAKSLILNRYSLVAPQSASAVTPSEKRSINTNMKSTPRFPMSLR